MRNEKYYRIRCTTCDEILVRRESIQGLMQRFFVKVVRHNMDDMPDEKLCKGAIENISLNDLQNAFHPNSPNYVIEEAVDWKPKSWEKLDK